MSIKVNVFSNPSKPQIKILKTYSNSTGRKFASVEINGQRIDVLLRGERGGGVNDFGDIFPIEEYRAKYIKEKASEKLGVNNPQQKLYLIYYQDYYGMRKSKEFNYVTLKEAKQIIKAHLANNVEPTWVKETSDVATTKKMINFASLL